MKHPAHPSLSHHFSVALIGAGGTGSHLLSGLARLNTALLALDHDGFTVDVFDPDRVTESNVGRQLFSPADIGQSKAAILVHRVNLFYGTDWKAVPKKLAVQTVGRSWNMVISCVDTKASRRAIHRNLKSQYGDIYWLDCGNDTRSGQVVLGMMSRVRHKKAAAEYLPNVLDLFPELTHSDGHEDNTPSCSLAQSLERQDLFINQTVATFALDLLWQLLRRGEIEHHGAFINLANGRVTPLPVDPEAWSRMSAAESVTPRRKKTSRKAR